MTKGGAYVVYSVPNQQWFVMWFSQIMSKWNTEAEAIAEFNRITEGVK